MANVIASGLTKPGRHLRRAVEDTFAKTCEGRAILKETTNACRADT